MRLLFASDLHLGWPWSNRVADQLVQAVQGIAPHFIVFGGDLADTHQGLHILHHCVAACARIAPVFALPGNHDVRLGVDKGRATTLAAGGTWLDKEVLLAGTELFINANLQSSSMNIPRTVLCAHNPSIFPSAVTAGFRLVLAGHLHGGQCVLATRRNRLYPGAWFARWTGLRFTRGSSTMIVSRGAADTFPVRWNCPREVILCEIS